MAVTIAENIEQNLDGVEKEKLDSFKQNPGYGGQRLRVRINHSDQTINHVTYGAGPLHTSIFYTRSGDDYQIVGVGQHDGKKGGKTVYNALWAGRQNRRVQVIVLGSI